MALTQRSPSGGRIEVESTGFLDQYLLEYVRDHAVEVPIQIRQIIVSPSYAVIAMK
jgi:hypothetical protein